MTPAEEQAALHERVKDPNRHVYVYVAPDANLFPPELIAQGDKFFDQAQQLTANDPLASEYVAKSRPAATSLAENYVGLPFD